MKLFKKKPAYYCKHCGKKHVTAFMASICFDLDMKILKYDSDEKKRKDNKTD